MEQLLVTGGAGFIGSHFVKYMLRNHAEVQVTNLDLLTYAGGLDNLTEVQNDPRHRFVHGDVRDAKLIDRLFREREIDTVVHFAAQSHVDRSIDAPAEFLSTNVLGTQTVLEAARRHWKVSDDPHDRKWKPNVRFLQISTDEVYGALGATGRFTETHPLAPNSPYSASKAGADLLVRSYYMTYGLPVNITRCGNNYGSHQHPEKLIPLMVNRCLRGERLPVYGDGQQVRDWVYVGDHCEALETVLLSGTPGEIYNIGGDCERTNLELVRAIVAQTGRSEDLIVHTADRPGHDWRYAVDHGKLTRELGWTPHTNFAEGFAATVMWYQSHADWLTRRA